jgi:general secretion pathway protein D
MGDTFELLRIQPDSNGIHIWYLVQDDQGNKVYLSSLLSSISESRKGKSPQKQENVFARNMRKLSLENNESEKDSIPPIPKDLLDAKFIDLNFLGADIREIIATFCELMKLDYVIESEVSGKVTLQTFNRVAVEELYYVIEEILALHNIAVIKSGHFYRFIAIADAAKKPLNIYYGDDPNIPDEEQPIIHIISLKHVSFEKMESTIKPLLSNHAQFQKISDTNNIIMVELASNARRIIKVVEALDVDRLAFSDAKLFRLLNADSEIAVVELEEVFTSLGYGDALGKSLSFQSLERMNSILVVNNFENLQPLIEFWIKKLDEPVTQGEISTFVYRVQNVDAAELASLLNSIFNKEGESQETDRDKRGLTRKRADQTDKARIRQGGDSRPASQAPTSTRRELEKTKKEIDDKVSGDQFEGKVEFIPDAVNNSLIIRTNPKNYKGILEILGKMDLFPQQVLIEVLILDLTIDSDTLAGISWALQGTVDGATVTGGVRRSVGSLGDSIGSATATLLQGGSFFVGKPDRLFFLLRAFAADSKVDIISNPILMTLDNQPASISITQEIPIESASLVSNSATSVTQSTIEFRSVGVKLDILPQINSDNFVHLKIDQEISSVGPLFTTGETTTPSFNTRFLSTQVVIEDNQVLVMGGLMENRKSVSNEGIPALKDIPMFGYLFGSDTIENSKTELMLFIIPHVISSPGDSIRITREFKHRLGQFQHLADEGEK